MLKSSPPSLSSPKPFRNNLLNPPGRSQYLQNQLLGSNQLNNESNSKLQDLNSIEKEFPGQVSSQMLNAGQESYRSDDPQGNQISLKHREQFQRDFKVVDKTKIFNFQI